MDAPRRVVVLGAGGIGAAVGALLHERGTPCTLVARGEHGRAIAERGVELRFPDRSQIVRVETSGPPPTPDDLVIVATMAQHTEEALRDVDPRVTVASFQNGTAAPDAIVRRGHPTLVAMLWLPAERRAPGVIALAGVPVPGVVLVGGWPSGEGRWSRWLATQLAAAGLRTEVEPDIAPWVRAKLLVNLAGIVVALSDDVPEDVIDEAREEARRVWREAGQPFFEIPDLMARIGPFRHALVDGKERVNGSTRMALARGDRLETAWLNGRIVDRGRAEGIPTPLNEALVALSERSARERWTPGALSADELRELLRAGRA
jgi:2-dehydropantoate 2-reductase